MNYIKSFLLGCVSIIFSTSLYAFSTFSITNLNIEWFGNANESRTETIHKFLTENDLFSDVMIFEEIVDIGLLEIEIMPDYDCVSYENSNSRHQHVVICVKPEYSFEMVDGSYTIDAVNVNGRLRPAVHGEVKVNGQPIHIIGVHLKASPDMSDIRLKQTQVIADYLKQKNKDSVIIMGDFNTYGSDTIEMAKQFVNLVEVTTPEKYSWASTTDKFSKVTHAKLDRVWVSSTLAGKVVSAHIIGPCNGSTETQVASYNKEVSDHCPVKLILNDLAKINID